MRMAPLGGTTKTMARKIRSATQRATLTNRKLEMSTAPMTASEVKITTPWTTRMAPLGTTRKATQRTTLTNRKLETSTVLRTSFKTVAVARELRKTTPRTM